MNNKTEILIGLVPRLVSSTKWLFTTAIYTLQTGTKADSIIGDTDVLVLPILCEEY